MQALTSSICKGIAVGTEGLLKDTRDNKTYWVAKLKDNNCWMTQNLDYDDASSTKVAAPSNWTSTDASYRAYYDPGGWVYTNITPSTACPNSATGLAGCTGYGWLPTTGLTASTDPTLTVAIDYGEGVYNAHYHAGNYYSFQSATNGTGSSATSSGANATGSICPTNWKLPTSNSTTASGSFGLLLSGLGSGTTWANAITAAPYYFTAGGSVYSGSLRGAGNLGFYWSSTANRSTNAYILYFDSSTVDPSNYNARYYGLSVRCLVQGS